MLFHSIHMWSSSRLLLLSLSMLPWNLGSFCVLTQGQYPTLHWAQGNRCLTSGAGTPSCIEHSHSVKDIASSAVCNFGSKSVLSTAAAKQASVGWTFFSLSLVKGHTLLFLPLTCPYVLALWGNYHYLLCSIITAEIKKFKLPLRRMTTEPQSHIAWCISCCTPSQLHAAQLRTAVLGSSWASSAPPPSRSCWPAEGDSWAQPEKAFPTAGMGAGDHTREKYQFDKQRSKCKAF